MNVQANPSITPVYRGVASAFRSMAEARTSLRLHGQTAAQDEAIGDVDLDRYIYVRFRNPTVEAVEKTIRLLEGSQWALLLTSGMAAIDCALSIFQQPLGRNTWVFLGDIYAGTASYTSNVLHDLRGIDVRYISSNQLSYETDALENCIASWRPSVVFLENPSNPFLGVIDCKTIVALSKQYGFKVVVDSTLATPFLARPLDAGADLVVHSASKFFSGHGDLCAGVVCGNDMELAHRALDYRRRVGSILGADDAARLASYLLTFEMRFVRQCENARALVPLFSMSQSIERIWLPKALHQAAAESEIDPHRPRPARGLFLRPLPGAVITFEVGGENLGTHAACERFVEAVSPLICYSASLGSVKSNIFSVGMLTGKSEHDHILRLSVGVENLEDLTDTISQGLKAI